ncbi:bifunctional folylpolyglutamate synthase/dihydrofolate synthase [Facklamia sp. DSM 111018]|uniref:tetrahydrofolate synthase n=1 Tax=Facklamia lactis TaxID=2749967 RepID=A0ABS0LNB0_9LACT|nr:folylpolyglutamate synthase/dihydrofolate synthase family protein [Facklamia lactis]MBG9979667.1 bifunctional folylpolyglutamate synthase/dihydrofolate synthase [Facklamia lactis]MBG9985653.1 bifunctional folylpolyglutamate synthase/dihydrofolate synthase [Facklamia lactis]
MKFTKVEEATNWLLSQVNPIPRPDMTKMYQALEYVGNPHRDLPVIHITGTNGKGSTLAYLRDMLLSQGVKVGTFTSPHIMRFNERIAFNGENISDRDLIRLTNQLVELNEYMEAESEYGRLIYFELFTIMMALYFQEKKAEICLIEAGIGGMQDCTNVLDGEIAVITSIAMDHADMLGDSLEAIALEKAGIIKTRRHVVTGQIQASPLAVIDKWAQARRAQHDRFNHEFSISEIQRQGAQGTCFKFSNQEGLDLDVTISMIGDHQIRNASLAIQVFHQWMNMRGQSIDWRLALKAMNETQWLGRLEQVHQAPYIYLDGAHNLEGLEALKAVVTEYLQAYHLTVIYGGLKKKNQAEQVPLLLDFESQKIFLTSFKHFESMQKEDFEEIRFSLDSEKAKKMTYVSDWQEWLDTYIHDHQGQEEALLLITGSLYFVSEARNYLLN